MALAQNIEALQISLTSLLLSLTLAPASARIPSLKLSELGTPSIGNCIPKPYLPSNAAHQMLAASRKLDESSMKSLFA